MHWRLVLAIGAILSASQVAHAQSEASASSPETATTELPPVDATRLVKARKVIDLAFPVERRDALFNGMQDTLVGQLREVYLAQLKNSPGAKAIVERHLNAMLISVKALTRKHIPDMMDGMAHAYAREFSLSELDSIEAFVSTDAGQRYMTRGSSLLADPWVAAANKRLFEAAQPIQETAIGKLRDELLEYLKQHPPAPSSGI